MAVVVRGPHQRVRFLDGEVGPPLGAPPRSGFVITRRPPGPPPIEPIPPAGRQPLICEAVISRLRLNHWALAGDWTVERSAIVGNQAGGRILHRFSARDLHLVMAPPAPGTSVRFRVALDGEPPGAGHGIDVDDQGNGTLTDPRLYQLVRQPGPVTERTFEVIFLDPGVQAYAFTFG